MSSMAFDTTGFILFPFLLPAVIFQDKTVSTEQQ